MARSRHPDKEIEEAVAYAEQAGWRVVPVKGHAWASIAPRPTATGASSRYGVHRKAPAITPERSSGQLIAARISL
jgi:hypothetical protein